MPVLPPQSQHPPEIAERFHDAAPAAVTSPMSKLLAVILAAVTVLVLPIVDGPKKILFTAELPVRVSTFVMVITAVVPISNAAVFCAGPLKVRL